MAASKVNINRHVRDFLARELDPGNEQITGTFALRGPSPYLRMFFLLTVWTVLPVVALQLWKFRFLAVTRDFVVVVAISKLTLAPMKIVSITPRGQARIEDVREGAIWSHFRLTDAAGTTHRYHTSRPFRRDLDGFLAHLGARSVPHTPEQPGVWSQPTQYRG